MYFTEWKYPESVLTREKVITFYKNGVSQKYPRARMRKKNPLNT
jgi:hypothetical protein